MPTEFVFSLFNTPGVLAELGGALGRRGINIKALVSLSLGDKADLHLVVDDADAAARELQEYGVHYRRREVLEFPVRDEPGALGTLADAVTEAGGNIEAAYLTTSGTVILAVNDLADLSALTRRFGPSV